MRRAPTAGGRATQHPSIQSHAQCACVAAPGIDTDDATTVHMQSVRWRVVVRTIYPGACRIRQRTMASFTAGASGPEIFGRQSTCRRSNMGGSTLVAYSPVAPDKRRLPV